VPSKTFEVAAPVSSRLTTSWRAEGDEVVWCQKDKRKVLGQRVVLLGGVEKTIIHSLFPMGCDVLVCEPCLHVV